jgi:hypothetical protein
MVPKSPPARPPRVTPVGLAPQKTKEIMVAAMITTQSHFECLRIVPIISEK